MRPIDDFTQDSSGERIYEDTGDDAPESINRDDAVTSSDDEAVPIGPDGEDLGGSSPALVSARELSPDPPAVGLQGSGGFQVLREEASSQDDGPPLDPFPLRDFQILQDGLAKVPWTVHPHQLNICLQAALEIEREYNGIRHANRRDQLLVRRLLRDAAPNALEKCLDDVHVRRWGQAVQHDIYRCLFSLVDVTLARLNTRVQMYKAQHAPGAVVDLDDDAAWGEGGEDWAEEEEDLRELMSLLVLALEWSNSFNAMHRDDPLPVGEAGIPQYVSRWTEHRPAAAGASSSGSQEGLGGAAGGGAGATTRRRDIDDDATSVGGGGGSAGTERRPQYVWMTNLLEHFGGHTRKERGKGFSLFATALCTLPDADAGVAGGGCVPAPSPAAARGGGGGGAVSLALADQMLMAVEQVVNHLRERALDQLARGARCVLAHMGWAIESDRLDLLSSGSAGTPDPLFTTASNLLMRTWVILSTRVSGSVADEAVSVVQRALILRLLGAASFNKHLAAVREIDRLLTRAQRLIDVDGGVAMESSVSWLRSHGLVQRLLRTNLHQKQYVDQVQKVLKVLCTAGGLQEEHLDLLWTVTEKADTFEVVKNNVFHILGELSAGLPPPQLDLLFKRFERCKGWPASDTLKLVELMRRFAKSDERAVMADRVLRLLWDLAMDPNAPVEVVKSGALQEVVAMYDGVSDVNYVHDFSQRCVDVIRGNGCNVLAALHLLKELVTVLSVAAAAETVATTATVAAADVITPATLGGVGVRVDAQDSTPTNQGQQHLGGPRPDVVDRLERQFQLVELILGNLEALVDGAGAAGTAGAAAAAAAAGVVPDAAAGAAAAAGAPAMSAAATAQQQQGGVVVADAGAGAAAGGAAGAAGSGGGGGAAAGPGGYDAAVRDYLDFLLYIAISGRPFEWPQVERVWAALVERSGTANDRGCALRWAMHMQRQGGMDAEAARQLLRTRLTAMDPAQFNNLAWEGFMHFFRQVNLQEAKLRFVRPGEPEGGLEVVDLDFEGADQLWRIALGAPASCAPHALKLLVSAYSQLGGPLAAQLPEVRREFLLKCVRLLRAELPRLGLGGGGGVGEAAAAVAAGPDAADAETEAAARHADRCLQLMLEMVTHHRQDRRMPLVPGHGASYQGPSVRLEVQAAAALSSPPGGSGAKMMVGPNGRIPLTCHRNQHIGLLRGDVAARIGAEPQFVRLLCGGLELSSDAAVVSDYPALNMDGTVIVATTSPMPNSFTLPPGGGVGGAGGQADQAADPAGLLIGMDVHDMLLQLTQHAPSADLRRNASRLLDVLPTQRSTLHRLLNALAAEPASHATDALQRVMLGAAAAPEAKAAAQQQQVHPAGLLYNVQALCALLYPIHLRASVVLTAAASAVEEEALRVRFVEAGGVQVLLGALQAARQGGGQGDGSAARDLEVLRCLYETSLHLLRRLLQTVLAMEGRLQLQVQQRHLGIDPTSDAAQQQVQQAQSATQVVSPRLTQVVGRMMGFCVEAACDCAGSWGAAGAHHSQAVLQRLVADLFTGGGGGSACGGGTGADVDEKMAVECIRAVEQLLGLCPPLLAGMVEQGKAGEAMTRMLRAALLDSMHSRVRHAALQVFSHLAARHPPVNQWLLGLLPGWIQVADSQPQRCSEYYNLLLAAISSISTPAQLHLGESILPTLVSGLDACVGHTPASAASAAAAAATAVAGSTTSTTTATATTTSGNASGTSPALAQARAAAAVDEGDRRVEGKLRCVTAACVHMDPFALLPSGGGLELLHRLLAVFLFPEAAYIRSVHQGRAHIDPDQLQAAMAPVSARGARKAALTLVVQLMARSSSALRRGAELLLALHYSHDSGSGLLGGWDMTPKTNIRSPGQYCGLKNGGATCYMNAVFQQLFMQPDVRARVMAHKEPPSEAASGPSGGGAAAQGERSDSVLHQLQVMFAHLALTNVDWYIPGGFWRAFKDYDGNPVNLREHQDAYEFFNRLQDAIDCGMSSSGEEPAMQRVLGGRFAQQIICRGVPFRSEREEEFYAISVDVRGKRGLVDSLESYVQGELMEGDNQYLWEVGDGTSRKVDAVKRSCIKQLPSTLMVHLKRFEYDYESMNRWKVRDRFEFPLVLDMWPYTVEGLAAVEEQQQQAASEDAASAGVAAAAGAAQGGGGDALYELQGIVVHSGTAFAGHYYSYIKARPEPGVAGPLSAGANGAAAAAAAAAGAGRWYCFDDHLISPWDARSLEQDCFGGRASVEVLDGTTKQTVMQEYDRPNSAYMLVYERMPGGSTTQAAAAQAVAAAPTADANGGSPARAASSTAPMAVSPLPSHAQAAAAAATAASSGSMITADGGGGGGGGGESDADAARSTSMTDVPPMAAASHPQQHQPEDATPGDSTMPMDVELGSGQQPGHQPVLPYNMPHAIYEEVMLGNLEVLEERHLLDRDYFAFMRHLVEAAATAHASGGATKMRRTTAGALSPTQQQQQQQAQQQMAADVAPTAVEGAGGSVGVRGEDRDGVAVLVMRLAMNFMCRVYMRASSTLRDPADMAAWALSLELLMEASQPACAAFLDLLVPQPGGGGAGGGGGGPRNFWLSQGLMLAPSDDVRSLMQRLLLHALRTFMPPQGAGQLAHTQRLPPHSGSAHRLLQELAGLLRGAWAPTAQAAELCSLLADFASLGANHTALLLQTLPPEGVPQVVEAAGRASARFNSGDGSFPELMAALRLVAATVRHLDLTPFQRHHSNLAEGGGAGAAAGGGGGGNPHAAPGPLASISEESFQSLVQQQAAHLGGGAAGGQPIGLVALCLEDHAIANVNVLSMLHQLQWRCTSATLTVVRGILQHLMDAPTAADLHEDVPGLAALGTGVADELTHVRLNMLLCGDLNSQGIFQQLQYKMHPLKRVVLLRLVAHLGGFTAHQMAGAGTPEAAAALRQTVGGFLRLYEGVWRHQLHLLAQLHADRQHNPRIGGEEEEAVLAETLQQCARLLDEAPPGGVVAGGGPGAAAGGEGIQSEAGSDVDEDEDDV